MRCAGRSKAAQAWKPLGLRIPVLHTPLAARQSRAECWVPRHGRIPWFRPASSEQVVDSLSIRGSPGFNTAILRVSTSAVRVCPQTRAQFDGRAFPERTPAKTAHPSRDREPSSCSRVR